MGVLSTLFRTNPVELATHATEQEAIVCLKLSDEQMGTFRERHAISELRDRLIRAVQARSAGEFENLEFAEGFGTLSFSGPNADRLAEVVLPVVQTHESRCGSYLLKRYGDGARELSIVLGARG